MATTSINTPFGGGSGYDLNTSLQEIAVNNLIGNYFSGLVGSYFGKKSSKKQLEKQIAYQKHMATWAAQELPLLQRQGYEKAGINPLLPYHSGVGSQSLPSASALQMFHSMPNLGANSHSSADAKPFEGQLQQEELKVAKETLKTAKAEASAVQAESTAREAEASARSTEAVVRKTEAIGRIAALTGERPPVFTDGQGSLYYTDRFNKFVQQMENEIDSSAYQNSVTRRVLFDIVNGAESATKTAVNVKGAVTPRKINYKNTFHIHNPNK